MALYSVVDSEGMVRVKLVLPDETEIHLKPGDRLDLDTSTSWFTFDVVDKSAADSGSESPTPFRVQTLVLTATDSRHAPIDGTEGRLLLDKWDARAATGRESHMYFSYGSPGNCYYLSHLIRCRLNGKSVYGSPRSH